MHKQTESPLQSVQFLITPCEIGPGHANMLYGHKCVGAGYVLSLPVSFAALAASVEGHAQTDVFP